MGLELPLRDYMECIDYFSFAFLLLFSTAHTYSSRLPGADSYTMASTEREKMLRGELYCAFTPDLIAARTRCKWACNRFNRTDEAPRRQLVELWKE